MSLNKPLKWLLAAAALATLLLPIFQESWAIFPERSLGGYVAEGEQPVLNWRNWETGAFQGRCDSFVNHNIGLRGHLVRLHNQFQWDLFREHQAKKVVVGKEDYLFETHYIYSHLGRDYMGDEAMEEKSLSIKEMQDTLAAHGIGFTLVFAPSKAAYHSEYLPSSWAPERKRASHYDYLAKRLPALGVNLVDFDAWFRELKPHTPYPLFPKSGIHWSIYGAYLAADSLLRGMEGERGCPLPKMALDTVIVSEENYVSDYDIGNSLNLLRHSNVFPMGYPVFHYENQPGQKKPKTLVIGDSFFFILRRLHFHRTALGGGHFWYYNKQVFAFPGVAQKNVRELDILSTILEHEHVIVISTLANLYGSPWGFDENVLSLFGSEFEHRVQFHSARMWRSEDWLEIVRGKAEEQGRSLEEMIRLDAEWLATEELAGRMAWVGEF